VCRPRHHQRFFAPKPFFAFLLLTSFYFLKLIFLFYFPPLLFDNLLYCNKIKLVYATHSFFPPVELEQLRAPPSSSFSLVFPPLDLLFGSGFSLFLSFPPLLFVNGFQLAFSPSLSLFHFKQIGSCLPWNMPLLAPLPF